MFAFVEFLFAPEYDDDDGNRFATRVNAEVWPPLPSAVVTRHFAEAQHRIAQDPTRLFMRMDQLLICYVLIDNESRQQAGACRPLSR